MPPDFFSSRATVIACGASHTALGVFRRRGRKLCLEHYTVEQFPAPAGGEADWVEQTAAALRNLRTKMTAGGPVTLVLPAHLVLTKFLKTPQVGPAKRAKIIGFEARHCIPCALDDVVWDTVVAGESETEFEVLLAAAKHDAVAALCDAAVAAGFEPQLALPAPLALLAAFRLTHPGPTGSSLVLSLGGHAATILLADSKRFMVRTLLMGRNRLTGRIATNQENGAEAAEQLATHLAQEVTRSVMHFRRQSNLEPPACVQLTGGAQRPGLAEALARRLKVPVGRLDVRSVVAFPSGSDATEPAFALTDLVGAAATQLLPGHSALNLLPQGLRRQANLRRRQPWLIAAAVLAVVALLPPAWHYRQLAGEARRKSNAIERELGPLRERAVRHRVSLQQAEELRQQVARWQGVLDRRASWVNLFADLQERLGRTEDVWLEKMQVRPSAGDAPMCLFVSGRMLDKTNPLSKASPETANRVKTLLRDIDRSPYVKVAEEGQRFDNTQPGILQFEFVLLANPARPL